MRIPGILVVVAALAAAGSAHAQVLVGAGANVSVVGEPRAGASHVGAGLHLRAGWSLGPNTALMLEGTLNGLDSSWPDSTPVYFGSYQHFSRTLKTEWLLASVQYGSRALYVRPGLGIARHAFSELHPDGAGGAVGWPSWETVPALGLAVGREVRIPGFPLNVEATAGWSGDGENGTNSRWTAGLQVVRVIRFSKEMGR